MVHDHWTGAPPAAASAGGPTHVGEGIGGTHQQGPEALGLSFPSCRLPCVAKRMGRVVAAEVGTALSLSLWEG